VTALLRMVSGVVADKVRRHKEVAAAGYALSAAGKVALVVAGTAALPVIGAVILDRVGKGIRTAPRDALISHSAPPTHLGEAFGVHRALDTAGALLGPVLAFMLLALVPGRFDTIFVTSLAAAIVGLAILLLFVQNCVAGTGPGEVAVVSTRAALGLLRRACFRALVTAGALLSAATASDSFIYLTFQRRSDLDTRFFPLFYVGTALVYLLLAVPAGRAADRHGRRRMFIGGYVPLLAAYVLMLIPNPGIVELLGCLILLGAYYAATDGILMALASEMLPRPLLATGMSILTTATALMRFAAAIAFGALWSWGGPELAVAVFAVSLGMALVAAGVLVSRSDET
jgi:MFS family permease